MGISEAIAGITRLALPPRCPGCGAVTSADHRFCATCWQSLRFVTPPWCAGCGVPFAYDRGEGALCATCLSSPPRHSGVRAAVAYGPVARTVVLRLKYGGRIAFADTVAGLMARHVPLDTGLIVPVPLHRWRLWSRGFNQAALMAGAIGSKTGISVDPFILKRNRATPVLRGLGGRARRRAVAAAFVIDPAARAVLNDRAILLIDDVYTSGATTDACAAVLLRAGARSVTILCWARVLGEDAD